MSNRSEGDWGQTELDETEQAEAEINLDDPSAGDDEPWSPPDRQPRGAELAEVEDETLSMRMMQEQPEAELDEGPMLGGDDPDAIPADEDVLGGDADEDESFDLDGDPGPESRAMHIE
ncbi:MAG: hypothetical protein ABIR39_08515 [Nocardioides sp.]|uniref:hypothetical protein n=1 Tax=Nocardioides sp. TaxID=35761 RepID=UPI00326401CA